MPRDRRWQAAAALAVVLACLSPAAAQIWQNRDLFPIYCRDPVNVAVIYMEGPSPYESLLLSSTAGVVAPTAINLFVVPERLDAYGTNLSAAVQAGAFVGQRWSLVKDSQLGTLTMDEIHAELVNECKAIQKATGKVPKYLIMPAGEVTAEIQALAAAMGYITPGVAIDFADTVARDGAACTTYFTEKLAAIVPTNATYATNGFIIWQRDSFLCTVSQAAATFGALILKGYTPVSIGECFRDTSPYRDSCDPVMNATTTTTRAAATSAAPTSSAVAPASSATTSAATMDPNPQNLRAGEGPSTGMIVGIVGVCAGVVASALAALYFYRKRRSPRGGKGYTVQLPSRSRPSRADASPGRPAYKRSASAGNLVAVARASEETAGSDPELQTDLSLSSMRTASTVEPAAAFLGDRFRQGRPPTTMSSAALSRMPVPPPSGSTLPSTSVPLSQQVASAPLSLPAGGSATLAAPHPSYVAYGGRPGDNSVEIGAPFVAVDGWVPQNSDEIAVDEHQEVYVWVLYRDGWCVATNSATNMVGNVPFVILVPAAAMSLGRSSGHENIVSRRDASLAFETSSAWTAQGSDPRSGGLPAAMLEEMLAKGEISRDAYNKLIASRQ